LKINKKEYWGNMFNVLTLNKISPKGLELFDKSLYNVSDSCENPDAIVLRSFNMHEYELNSNLKAVARAGAGVNNIPIGKCTEKGIVVFNTPGANANAVKELAIAGLLLASRKIAEGIIWAKSLKGNGDEIPKMVEKGKGQFAGPEIEGKTLAVIGLGAIGVMVANAAHELGMEVVGYDPFISVKSALGLSRYVVVKNDFYEVIKDADYITLHVPLNDNTRNMINKSVLDAAKDGVRILNFSRGELVNDDDIVDALESGKVSSYVTDFPNEKVLSAPNVVPIPHLGASTPESEDNCAKMAVKQLADYLENGNITNSVNFPDCEMPRSGKLRITIAHKNIPTMLSQFSAIMAKKSINIANMINKSKQDIAYTIMDIDSDSLNGAVEDFKKIDGVISVRIIN